MKSSDQRILKTAESFETWSFTNNSGANQTQFNPIPRRIHHTLHVPQLARVHFIYIASGACNAELTSHWWLQGQLEFLFNGNPVGEFEFSDASKTLDATDRLTGKGTITRIAADAAGSVWPIIRYQEAQAVQDRTNLDMACFPIRLQCDTIRYRVNGSYTLMSNLTTIKMLTGMRIVSMP